MAEEGRRPDGSALSAGSGRDRAIGALVGFAVGDAVGTTVEFARPGTFTPVTDKVGGGPFGLPVGAWTDDTSMAMCLAESVLDRGTLDPVDQLSRYLRWFRDGYWSSTGFCFDIGTTTRVALRRFETTGEPFDPHPDDEAAANGSLMRLAGVPIRWHTDLAEAAERSAESSRTTHPASRPTDACRVLGAMTAALIDGTPDTEPTRTTESQTRWNDGWDIANRRLPSGTTGEVKAARSEARGASMAAGGSRSPSPTGRRAPRVLSPFDHRPV